MRYITDAGHGWLEVPLDLYPEAAECGTGFGYIDSKARIIYLEEDCEMGAFLGSRPDLQSKVVYTPMGGDCFVRSLPRNEKRMTMNS